MNPVGRFFQCLEEGIGRVGGHRLGRVDDDDPAFGFERSERGRVLNPPDHTNAYRAGVAVIVVGLNAQRTGRDDFDVGVLWVEAGLRRVV